MDLGQRPLYLLNTGNPPITTLINGCCNNDRQSQHTLYHMLYGHAMRTAFRYIHQQEDAEELVHEAFIKLFRNIAQFQPNDPASAEVQFRAWFKRIIINTCIDHLRKTHLTIISIDDQPEAMGMGEKGETGLDRLAYEEIIHAIRELTPVYRTVFNLFVIEGYSHEEIATTLGISIGASKSNLSKAKHNLRKIISQRIPHHTHVASR